MTKLKTFEVEIDQAASEVYTVRAKTVSEAKQKALKRHRSFPAKWFHFTVEKIDDE